MDQRTFQGQAQRQQSKWKESETERCKGQAAAKGIRTGSENLFKTLAQLPFERQEYLNVVVELQKDITSGSNLEEIRYRKVAVVKVLYQPVGFTCTRAEV